MDQQKQFETLSDNELIRLSKDGDTENIRNAARNTVILRQSDNVQKAAWKHIKWKNSCAFEDLVQEAWRGVIKAIESYDESYTVPFECYSYQWCDAYVRYSIYDKGRAIKTPVNKIRALTQVKSYIEIFKEQHGHDPSESELSKMTGLSVAYIKKTLKHDIHLCSTVVGQDQDEFEQHIPSTSDSPSQVYEKKEHIEIIEKLISKELSDLERTILIGRLGLYGSKKKTLEQLSYETSYTKPGVRAVEHRAMDKLKLAYNMFEQGILVL